MARVPRQVLVVFSLLVATVPKHYAFNGEWLDTDYFKRTELRHEHDWDWDRTWTSWSVNNQPVSTVLSTVLGSYKFTLPRIFMQRGISYQGSATRLRRVVRNLMNRNLGRPVKVGVIGGSVAWGQGSRPRGEADWFSLVSKYLLAAFPHANITARNGCTPGVPATYMILCLELSLDPDVDLVFVEFTLNNEHDHALYGNRIVTEMERLVRRILALPGKPAVVLMHVPTTHMANYPPGHSKNPERDGWMPFYQTSEDAVGAVSQYYDVQALSLRTALYDLAMRQEKDDFLWEQAFVDHHPGNQGQKVMADLTVYLLQQTALGLLQVPYGKDDSEMAEAALPNPMYPGNVAPNATMCLMGDIFRSLAVEAPGFEYVNEGTEQKPKPGFVATQPGSALRLRINTDRAGVGGVSANSSVMVFFHCLRSYEHMGVANFSCVSGCVCPGMQVDGHQAERVSQLYMFDMAVSQHPECEVLVQVLDVTHSGEYKFKVAGMVVAERAGDDGIMGTMFRNQGAFGVREHNGDVQQVTYTREGRKGGTDAWA